MHKVIKYIYSLQFIDCSTTTCKEPEAIVFEAASKNNILIICCQALRHSTSQSKMCSTSGLKELFGDELQGKDGVKVSTDDIKAKHIG